MLAADTLKFSLAISATCLNFCATLISLCLWGIIGDIEIESLLSSVLSGLWMAASPKLA